MECLSIPNAAERLDVTPAANLRWLRLGRVRGYRVGSRIRVALPDLLEFTPPAPIRRLRSPPDPVMLTGSSRSPF